MGVNNEKAHRLRCALVNQYEGEPSHLSGLRPRTVADVVSAPGLVDRVFQGLAGFEGRNFTGGDFDGRTGLRVATGTSGTLAHGESTETYQGNLVTLFQSFTYRIDEGIQRTTSSGFGDIGTVCNFVNQLRFIHSYFPLLSNIAAALISLATTSGGFITSLLISCK